ncbi:MAG: hypothetical protein RIG84_14885 [Roseovarius sp.]
MGPVRRGLTLALLAALPLPAWADACAAYRPGWDGVPVGALEEALTLMMSPAALFLLITTALAFRLRRQWLTLALCLAWSGLVALVTFVDLPGGSRQEALAQGCIGPPTLFIALAGALCVALVLFTTPKQKGEGEGKG